MKKTALALFIMMGITISGFAVNPEKPGKGLKSKKKMTSVEKTKRPWEWRCFDVTYNLSCGAVYYGDVCVYTDLPFLTNQQFQTGWNIKNIAVCGIGSEWW